MEANHRKQDNSTNIVGINLEFEVPVQPQGGAVHYAFGYVNQ